LFHNSLLIEVGWKQVFIRYCSYYANYVPNKSKLHSYRRENKY